MELYLIYLYIMFLFFCNLVSCGAFFSILCISSRKFALMYQRSLNGVQPRKCIFRFSVCDLEKRMFVQYTFCSVNNRKSGKLIRRVFFLI